MDGPSIVAENRIKEALEAGVFDDLPGKGRPLDLSCDPFESPLAPTLRRILRDNEVEHPSLEARREMQGRTE